MQSVSHGLSRLSKGTCGALDYLLGMMFAPQWALRAVSFGCFRKHRSSPLSPSCLPSISPLGLSEGALPPDLIRYF
jgi:hypothetical protein